VDHFVNNAVDYRSEGKNLPMLEQNSTFGRAAFWMERNKVFLKPIALNATHDSGKQNLVRWRFSLSEPGYAGDP